MDKGSCIMSLEEAGAQTSASSSTKRLILHHKVGFPGSGARVSDSTGTVSYGNWRAHCVSITFSLSILSIWLEVDTWDTISIPRIRNSLSGRQGGSHGFPFPQH